MESRRAGLALVLQQSVVLPLDDQVVERYEQMIRLAGYLRSKVFNRLIAATAIVHDLTLVTIKEPDFPDIPGLKLEVWPAPVSNRG